VVVAPGGAARPQHKQQHFGMPKVLKNQPELDVITTTRDLQGLEILRGNFFSAARPFSG
jgi:hypothetical protein